MSRCFLLLALVPGLVVAQDSSSASGDAAAVVNAVHAAVEAGDIAAARALIADDVDIVHVMSRRFTQEVTADQLSRGLEQASGRHVEILAEVVDGPFVFQHQHIGDAANATMWMYEVRDGQIVNLWHFDAPSVMAAYEAVEE